MRHRLNVQPPVPTRESTLRWLAPTGELRLPLRHYPLDRSEPLFKPGERVAADTPLSNPRGLLALPIFAPLSGEVTRIIRKNNQVTILLKPEQGSQPGQGFPSPSESGTLKRTEIESLLTRYPLLDSHLPLLLKQQLLARQPQRRLIVNCLDRGVFMETRLRLLSIYGKQLQIALGLLEELFETRPQMLLPQKDRRQLLRDLPRLPAKLRWTRNDYPAHLEHLVVQAVTGKRLSPADLPEEQGIAVIELETLLHLYHLVVQQRPSPWQWLSLYDPASRQVGVLLTCRGVARGWLPAAYGESSGWISGDGYRRETSNCAPLEGMVQSQGLLPVFPDNCIRCGFCIKICPEKLTPFQITGLIETEQWQKADKFGLQSCCLCGSCAMVCPAHLDLLLLLQKGIAELHGI